MRVRATQRAAAAAARERLAPRVCTLALSGWLTGLAGRAGLIGPERRQLPRGPKVEEQTGAAASGWLVPRERKGGTSWADRAGPRVREGGSLGRFDWKKEGSRLGCPGVKWHCHFFFFAFVFYNSFCNSSQVQGLIYVKAYIANTLIHIPCGGPLGVS